MSPDSAAAIALQALGFLASDEARLGALLAQTGTSPQDLRGNIKDPVFLAGVMDFLLQNEAWLVEFAQTAGLRPESLMSVRAALPGGQHMGSI